MSFYYDSTYNVILYPRIHPFVAQAIPDARQVNGSWLAVPRTLQNLQTLRHYDQPVPPVMDDYDWPIEPGRRPWEKQVLAANFMVLHPRSFNLSDMGTGKSMTALWAADWLMRRYPGTRALIVAPLSTLETVWANALFRNFLSRRKFEILHGSEDRRLVRLAKPADFYIINHDGPTVGAKVLKKGGIELGGFSAALAAREDIRLVIVDEASAYKDAQTMRHRVARRVIGQRQYLWLMTGTPTPSKPTDAYGDRKSVV